jgi:hypothetical protein
MAMVTSRSSHLGPASRPVAIPQDFDAAHDLKVDGVVELPIHIWWSEPPRSFDLRCPKDRARVYELVLTEGDTEDVRRFVRLDVLLALWRELTLPTHVRVAWQAWFSEHGIVV